MVKEASGVAGLFLKSTANLHGPYILARTIKKNWSMEKNHADSPLNLSELCSRKIFNNKTGTMVGSFQFMYRPTFSSSTVHITRMKLNLNIPDFEQYTGDQQFVNVVAALEKLETQKGGLPVETIWGMAWQIVEKLRKALRPDVIVKRLPTLISSQLNKDVTADPIHSTHCIMFCVNYLLCANDEEPDPNQDIIDSISEQLSQMPDIVELFEAVEKVEDLEEAKGNVVEGRNVMKEGELPSSGLMHQMQEGDQLILSRLEALIGKGEWQGLSHDDVKNGLWMALGCGTLGLNAEESRLSEKLWTLLRKRRGQNTEGSVRITWLNMVGYFVNRKMLDGASPSLCRTFFPHLHGDEYKAIDKGRNKDIMGFEEITPLLDTYVKPKEK